MTTNSTTPSAATRSFAALAALVALTLAPGAHPTSAEPPRRKRAVKQPSARALLEATRAAIVAGRLDDAAATLARARKMTGVAEVDVLALSALIDLQRGRNRRAARGFRHLLKLQANRISAWLYLGQALYQLGRHRGALDALRRAEKVGARLAGYWVLRARCLLKLDRAREAFELLDRALRRFPKDARLLRDRALVLVRLELFSAALRAGQRYVARASSDPYAYLLLGEALRRAGSYDKAIVLLEQGRLRFPNTIALSVRLAYSYAAKRMLVTAARLFERVSLTDASYAFEAAEYYRLAGKSRDALRLNGKVLDAKRRLAQRLSVLVDAERWQLAASMTQTLARYRLLDDAKRYLLAYASLKSGDLDAATLLAAEIRSGTYHRSARRLRATVRRCKRTPARCY